MTPANSRLTTMSGLCQTSCSFLIPPSWEMNHLAPDSIVKSRAFQSTRSERPVGPWLMFLEGFKVRILTLLPGEFITQSQRYTGILLGFKKMFIVYFVTVNFICQLDWAIRCPDTWPNNIVGESVRVFLDEIHIWIRGLSKADFPP